jgi:hypothetical protein
MGENHNMSAPKTKYYRLDLENPCLENWKEMLPTTSGKYCDLCEKNVFDLRGEHQTAIMAMLQANGGKICGHMLPEQLNDVYTISQPIHDAHHQMFTSLHAGIVMASALLIAQPNLSLAKSAATNQPTEQYTTGNQEIPLKISEHQNTLECPNLRKLTPLSGTLTCVENKLPIPHARVMVVLLNVRFITKTDSLGKFYLEVPEDLLDDKILIHMDFKGVQIQAPENSFSSNLSYAPTTKIVSKARSTNLQFGIHILYPRTGGIGFTEINRPPLVYYNGRHVWYAEYQEALNDPMHPLELSNKDKLTLQGRFAGVLLEEASEPGLILIFDQEENP